MIIRIIKNGNLKKRLKHKPSSKKIEAFLPPPSIKPFSTFHNFKKLNTF